MAEGLTAFMKAAIVYAPGDFRVGEIEIPACPDDGMLLKVLACGLCGSDLRTLRSGHYKVSLPFIIGHEICGEVIETGKSYTGIWEKADRLAVSPLVYCGKCVFCRSGTYELCISYKEFAQSWPGGFAGYIAIPGEAVAKGTIQKIPDSMDPAHATLVEPLSSVVNAQEKGQVGLGDTVVIIGAGPVGLLHLQLARARGAGTIIVADINEDRLKMMGEFHPDHMINSAKFNLEEEVRGITRGMGADVVITANPAPVTQIHAVEIAKKGGRIMLFGGLPSHEASPGINMNTVHYNALHIIGTTIFAPRHNTTALELIISGRIDAEQIISHKFPLNDFIEGVRIAMEGKARKVVFIP